MTVEQDTANIKALAMTVAPASAGQSIDECVLALGYHKSSAGVTALPAAWSAATVTDGKGDQVAASPFTVVGHASLPVVTDGPLDLNGLLDFDPFSFADLATIKADGTVGDGNYTGSDFTTGQFVTLGDASVAHYASAAWSVGAAA